MSGQGMRERATEQRTEPDDATQVLAGQSERGIFIDQLLEALIQLLDQCLHRTLGTY